MAPRDADGHRLEFGSRQTYCPSSLADLAGERRTHGRARWPSATATTRRSRCGTSRTSTATTSPAAGAPSPPGTSAAGCEDRYGDLDGLNEAWGVNVWGQRYTSWDAHRDLRARRPGPINPTQLLDFERFSSDALLELFQVEIDVLREVTPDIAVTTNFMSMFRDLDYWDFAAVEDVVTDDAYPEPADPTSPTSAPRSTTA